MRTLKIERAGKITIEGVDVDLSKIEDKESFISSIITLDVELADDINISDIIHFFYDAKKLIGNVFSGEYETIRAMATSSSLSNKHKNIRFYKSFKIEKEVLEDNQNFIYLIPEIEFVESNNSDDGINLLGNLPVVIDENIKLEHSGIVIESKTKFSLLDLMICLFDELPAALKDGFVFS